MTKSLRPGPQAALARMKAICPGYDPIDQLVRFSTDSMVRTDPITQLPLQVAIDQKVQFQATKELAGYGYSKPKQIEISMDDNTIERTRLLAGMSLAQIVTELRVLGEKQEKVVNAPQSPELT